MTLNLKDLVIESVTAPRTVAERLMALPLRAEVLGILLALVAIVNTVFYSLSISLFETQTGVSTGMNLPILYLALLSAAMVIGALVLRWVGQVLGGRATLPQILVLVIWLQALRAVVQAGLLVIMALVPGLANLVAIGAGLLGLWIMVNFVDVAQGWNSLGKSFLVLVLTGLGFVLGLSFFMLLIGATAVGI